MPRWQWKEWERFIDWMALNGINMPLAITGQEAVWYKVWSKMGMSDIEIRSYFTGPPYLPWHRVTIRAVIQEKASIHSRFRNDLLTNHRQFFRNFNGYIRIPRHRSETVVFQVMVQPH